MKTWHFLLFCLPLATARLGLQQDRALQSETEEGVIEGEFIVVFHDKADSDKVLTRAIAVAGRVGDSPSVLFRYSHVFNGVAMDGLSEDAIGLLAQDQDVVVVGKVSTQIASASFWMSTCMYLLTA